MMTVVHKHQNGIQKAYSKGSPYDVLARCMFIYQDNELKQLTDEGKHIISEQISSFASNGYRVLAMASRQLPQGIILNTEQVEEDLTFLGLAALHDPPRPKVEAAVLQAKKAGVRVIMITGDHELTAESIARKVGIIRGQGRVVVTGNELNGMLDEQLTSILDAEALVFARTTPEHKLKIVKALMAKGEIVAVTGDGVNDSPALIEANVGIAMGAGGTDVARESADIILLDNDFSSIVEGLKLGRSTFDNLQKFVYYVYSHNFAELMAFLAFIILKAPLPLLVVQVLAIDLILEIPVSLALIAEPPEPDIMLRPPRSKKTRLMSGLTIARSALIGGFVGCTCILIAFSIWGSGGWRLGENTITDQNLYAMGTTAVLVGIMAGQLGNLLSTRTGHHSVFSTNPFNNKWIPLGILVQLLMLVTIVYVPFLQPILGTATLKPEYWFYLFLLMPSVILVEEIRKHFTKNTIIRTK
jgi:magnesium-transporting ATPase (P-type)